MLNKCPSSIRITLLISSLLLLTSAVARAVQPQPSQQTQIQTTLQLRWPGNEGVLRYRLQLAHDEKFQDIVFDRAVFGTEYAITNLAPGRYYWRVAPAVKETGTFSNPRIIEVTAQGDTSASGNNRTSDPVATTTASTRGWRTIIGSVSQPVQARLRTSAVTDVVAVNSDNRVYALDGANGLPLWVRRFRDAGQTSAPAGGGASSRVFTPVIVSGRDNLDDVLVAYDGGVRLLDGASGSELWKAPLSSRAAAGALASSSGDAARTIMIFSDSPPSLTILNPANGKVISEVKLDDAVVGSPVPFPMSGASGVVVAFAGGGVELRNAQGERTRAVKMDTRVTTQPLVVTGPRGTLVLVGTESGLISFHAEDLKPIGRIATGDDMPHGILAATDLDNDNAPEVLMLTRRGRLAAIGTTDGKIKWHTTGATDAASAVFADVDGDRVMDVLIAASPSFARGFSGRDGSLIWRAEDEARGGAGTASATAQLRSLLILSGKPDTLIVGADASGTGLRAVGLPKNTANAMRE